MKTWRRGRKPATPEQLAKSKERQKQRVKITNMVSRDKSIDKRCCICGKVNSPIFHNRENPYFITFLCKSCRKHKYNIKLAKLFRFDLKKYKQKQIANRTSNKNLSTKKLTEKEVKDIIDGYIAPSNTLSIKEYAEKLSISRYQFNSIIQRYNEYFPDNNNIRKAVKSRSNAIQRRRLSIATNYRNLLKKLENEENSEDGSKNTQYNHHKNHQD